MNWESYIFSQHKSTNSLTATGINKLGGSKSINTLSPTMVNSYSKLQNLRQLKKPIKSGSKVPIKAKMNVKRKNSKDKRISKYIDDKKQAAKIPIAVETTGSGFAFMSRNSNLDSMEKPNNSSIGNYIPLNKRNSSMEEYNLKGDLGLLKGHKRSNQDVKNVHMTMTNHLSTWEENKSTSPGANKKYSRDKLKKLTMHLGSGASRNNASKGILNSTNKTTKKKLKSPKYMTQNIGSYYLKGKNTSVLSG
jgi:hypothetical protein